MRIFVQNGGKNYVIPCKDASTRDRTTVAALKREVISRCVEGKPEDESKYSLVLGSSLAVLCERDAVQDVLQDGDFVSLRESGHVRIMC